MTGVNTNRMDKGKGVYKQNGPMESCGFHLPSEVIDSHSTTKHQSYLLSSAAGAVNVPRSGTRQSSESFALKQPETHQNTSSEKCIVIRQFRWQRLQLGTLNSSFQGLGEATL